MNRLYLDRPVDMSAPAEHLHVCIPGYAYCEDMVPLSNSNSRQKFARVRKTRREPNLTGSDGNLRNATLEQISNDMGRCTHEILRTGKQCAAEIFGGWRGCLCCLFWGCCCSGDGTTKGAGSRRFFHLRPHDLDMEGSVMCRLRAAVCGGVGVSTGREIQPSLRPQREVHAVSDKHKP